MQWKDKPYRTTSMALSFALILSLTVYIMGCHYAAIEKNLKNKAIIELQSLGHLKKTTTTPTQLTDYKIRFFPLQSSNPDIRIESLEGSISGVKVKWEMYADEPMIVNIPTGVTAIVHSGDSIHVGYDSNYVYSGKGSAGFNLQAELLRIEKKLISPTKNSFTINSLEEYLLWNKFIDTKSKLELTAIDSYKDELRPFEYEYYKAAAISMAEKDRIHAFVSLKDQAVKKQLLLRGEELNAIWDSTQYKPLSTWLRSISDYRGIIYPLYAFNKNDIYRKFSFNINEDSLKNKELRTYLYYMNAKQKFSGLTRERLLVYILDEPTITELGGNHPMTNKLLEDYYSQPGFPEYKAYVKSLKEKAKKL